MDKRAKSGGSDGHKADSEPRQIDINDVADKKYQYGNIYTTEYKNKKLYFRPLTFREISMYERDELDSYEIVNRAVFNDDISLDEMKPLAMQQVANTIYKHSVYDEERFNSRLDSLVEYMMQHDIYQIICQIAQYFPALDPLDLTKETIDKLMQYYALILAYKQRAEMEQSQKGRRLFQTKDGRSIDMSESQQDLRKVMKEHGREPKQPPPPTQKQNPNVSQQDPQGALAQAMENARNVKERKRKHEKDQKKYQRND